jgi:hypothetical protein
MILLVKGCRVMSILNRLKNKQRVHKQRWPQAAAANRWISKGAGELVADNLPPERATLAHHFKGNTYPHSF